MATVALADRLRSGTLKVPPWKVASGEEAVRGVFLVQNDVWLDFDVLDENSEIAAAFQLQVLEPFPLQEK